MSYSSEVLADAPIAYWKLDEASGQPQDSSGNGNHTTVTGGTPTYSVAGPIASDSSSKAISFNGTTGYFTAPSFNVGDIFTLEAWIKRSVLDSTERVIMGKGNVSTGISTSPSMYISSSDKILLVQEAFVVNGTSTAGVTDTTTWHHIVATKNGATIRLYRDGVDVTGTTTGEACTNTTRVFGIATAINNLGNPYELFPGALAHLAAYTTALSLTRIQAHYAAAQARVGGTQALSWLGG